MKAGESPKLYKNITPWGDRGQVVSSHIRANSKTPTVMKKLLTILSYIIVLLLLNHLNVQAQVYVDLDATGSGDGSSWANAYTDVQTAASAAPKGASLWIADGKYVLTETLTLEEADLDLYGGFAGTEMELGQRDFSGETILSGDVNADDTDGDLVTNSSDNLVHVIQIVESTATIIDGLVIEGGRGSLEGTFANTDATGGGVYCNGEINFINTKIRNNVARFGAGMYLINTIAIPGVYTFTNCQITGNESNSFGGGIYAAFGGTKVSFSDCTFQGNKARNGAGVIFGGSSVVTQVEIKDCMFTENEATNLGGGFRFDGMATGSISGCTFSQNKALRGAGSAFYLATVTLDDCLWEKNSCLETGGDPGLGGAVYIEEGCDITIDNSILRENSAENAGGGVLLIAIESIKNKLSMTNCSFEDNSTEDLGGALYSQNPAEIKIMKGTFSGNRGPEGGGIYLGGNGDLTIEASRFEDNAAAYGGAIYFDDASSSLTVSGSEFVGNMVATDGGALYNFDGSPWTISDCLFENNSSGEWGGAVFLTAEDSDNSTTIDRCQFISNSSVEAAGAIYHGDGRLVISNSLFTKNEASGDGYGNSISTNGTDGNAEPILLINNTFYENAEGYADVSPYADDDTEHIVEVQNCIFSGTGTSWMIEAGNVTQTSLGGNLATSEIPELLLHNSDKSSTDPLFTAPDNGDLTLQDGSPAINGGVADGAPATDINGADRDEMPDIGAYEFGGVTAVRDVRRLNGAIKLLGNPVAAQLVISWQGEKLLDARASIVDAHGVVLFEEGLDHRDTQIFDVNRLSSGNYYIVLKSSKGVAVKQFSKM